MDINKIVSPDDKFFKSAMMDLRVAKDFFTHHLPKEILVAIDLESLTIRKESFVEPDLQSSAADLLYSVDFEDKTGFIYIIAEHQSKPDKLMPFRMIKYMCKIIDQHLKENKTKELPVVYPLIFYNGKVSYPYSTDFFDLFEKNKSLAKKLFFNPVQLIDLGEIPDETIKAHKWAGLMEWFMKHIYVRDVLPYLAAAEAIFREVLQNGGAENYVSSVIYYLTNAAEIQSKEAFWKTLEKTLPNPTPEKTMTLAEMYRIEGREQGMEQAKHEIAKKLLSTTGDLNFVAKVTDLPLEEIEQIREVA